LQDKKDVLGYGVVNMKHIFLILALLGLCIIPASAVLTVTPVDVTSSSIMWQWDPTTVQNLSIDGLFVCGINPVSTTFILSDLGPNEPHTIEIITTTDSGVNTTTTLGDVNVEQSTGVLSLIATWWYLILIAILCLVGMKRKLGIFLIVASAVSIYALIVFINGNPITGTDPLIELPFIIYLIFFVVPLWLCFGVKGGVFK
jgi:hypothetical protein